MLPAAQARPSRARLYRHIVAGDCASEGDEGFEAGFRFFVTGGKTAKPFEFAEAAFDPITLFVEVFVVIALHLAVAFEAGSRPWLP